MGSSSGACDQRPMRPKSTIATGLKTASSNDAPSVCVISVALESERTIRRTIESVLGQTAPPEEYIVVDGASRDRTVAIAREYGPAITALVSARDGGIYDAMNRGLALARADVVGFLNSNDCYADASVLAQIREVLRNPRIDGCYGNLDFVDHAGRITRRWRSSAYSRRLLDRGWVPPHPTFYCRRSVLTAAGGFRKHFRIAGDYELFVRLLAPNDIRLEFIPAVLVKMETGGISNGSLRNIIAGNREVLKAWRENGLAAPPLIALRKPLSKFFQLRPTW